MSGTPTPSLPPPIPWLGDFNEVNVRTYVHCDGVPGVWFFSLDADSAPAVLGARLAYHLPYFKSAITCSEDDDAISYRAHRDGCGPAAELEARWLKGTVAGEASRGSLEFFLVERYCLYAAAGGQLYRARIHHWPWQLQHAELQRLRSTMTDPLGMPAPAAAPLVHYAERQDTAIWPVHRLDGTP